MPLRPVPGGPSSQAATWPAPPPYGEAALAFEKKNQARLLAERAAFEEDQRQVRMARQAEEHRRKEELKRAVEAWERIAPERETAEQTRTVLELELGELDERQGAIVRQLREIDRLCHKPVLEDIK